MTTLSYSSDLNIAVYKYLLQNDLKKTAKKFLKETKLSISDEDNAEYNLTVNKKDLQAQEEPKSKKQKKESPKEIQSPVIESPIIKNEPTEFSQTKKFFQRVDPQKVEFLDDRLKTNGYLESKSSSYGDRAYRDLSVTRGSDFKKEKNKKKKGTYSGGQIDTNKIHSIKFTDD
jgi:hypothetical protein